MRIVVLEDDADRIAEMQRLLQAKACVPEVFRSSHELVAALDRDSSGIAVLSLDHDLIDEGGRDLGTGRAVADFLAGRQPQFPVVIHSSNGLAADGMESVLQEARWTTVRVSPYEDLTWIEEAWFPAIRRILKPRKAR